MRSSANDGQLRIWSISSQQSNILLFKLIERRQGNKTESLDAFPVGSVQSRSRNGTQHGLVFPSPEQNDADNDPILLLDDAKELPDIFLP